MHVFAIRIVSEGSVYILKLLLEILVSFQLQDLIKKVNKNLTAVSRSIPYLSEHTFGKSAPC